MRLTLSLLGVEVFAISTDSTSLQVAEPGDATAVPMVSPHAWNDRTNPKRPTVTGSAMTEEV